MAESLPIPPVALTDQNSLEIARIWVANGGQHVSLNSITWEDPSTWGSFLVEFINRVVDEYESRGLDREQVMSRIRRGLEAEWDRPEGGSKSGFMLE